jgi:urease subunit beta
MKPGEYFLNSNGGDIQANVGRKTVRVLVANTGDRPIQVGSHYHFFETNASLSFDREAAHGMRLNIAAGTAVRFEPGEEKEVELANFGGRRTVHGFNGLVEGAIDDAQLQTVSLDRARRAGFAFANSNNKGKNE